MYNFTPADFLGPSTIFPYLSHLYPFLALLTNRWRSNSPPTPRILPTMFAVLFRPLFRGLLRLLLLRLLLSRSSFLSLLLGVHVRFVPEDASIVDAANVFLAHDAVLGPEEVSA